MNRRKLLNQGFINVWIMRKNAAHMYINNKNKSTKTEHSLEITDVIDQLCTRGTST